MLLIFIFAFALFADNEYENAEAFAKNVLIIDKTEADNEKVKHIYGRNTGNDKMRFVVATHPVGDNSCKLCANRKTLDGSPIKNLSIIQTIYKTEADKIVYLKKIYTDPNSSVTLEHSHSTNEYCESCVSLLRFPKKDEFSGLFWIEGEIDINQINNPAFLDQVVSDQIENVFL